MTLNLPEALAARLAGALPEAERDRFALTAIEDALSARLQEAEARLEKALSEDFEPAREAADYRAIIEEGLDDVDAGRDLVSFEEAQRRWTADKASIRG